MKKLAILFLFLPLSAQAQWVSSYPSAAGFDHQIYLEGYELPIMTIGAMDPAPSPDGQSLTFAARGWLWLLNLESGVAKRLTSSGGMDARPEWSPDGRKLVFVRDLSSHFAIVMLDVESGDETVLVNSEAINLDPVFA
ncbi:MAG TPA: hypothetical protein VJ984_08465, partial [Xanthomonadales bacterium]|nr:hypothetical protein [Xanthomonadales bacterium]